MIAAELAEEIAGALDRCERDREGMDPITATRPELTIPDAYAIQRRWTELKQSRGATVVGRKIGLTSRPMQELSGIDEPDYGDLFDDMLYADDATIPRERFIVPRIECELAFILRDELRGPRASVTQVLDATAWVVPALEIIDLRIRREGRDVEGRRQIVDTIADNAAAGALVMGGRPVRPTAVDLCSVPAVCRRNGGVQESGVSVAVLGHPAAGVAWLANALHAHGVSLGAGDIVLSGSFTRTVEVRQGDSFSVEFGELGTTACRFA